MTVTEFANFLDTSEFEIFERAHRHWYGCSADPRALERDFGRYLMHAQELPCYVRSYLQRKVVLAA